MCFFSCVNNVEIETKENESTLHLSQNRSKKKTVKVKTSSNVSVFAIIEQTE